MQVKWLSDLSVMAFLILAIMRLVCMNSYLNAHIFSLAAQNRKVWQRESLTIS